MAESNLPLSYNLGEVACPVCEDPEALDQIFTINYTDDRSNEHYSICTVCKHVFTFETVPFEDGEGNKVQKLVEKRLLPIEILEAAQAVRERQLTPEQLQSLRDKQAKRQKREERKHIERIAELNPNIEETFEKLFEQHPELFETLADKEE